MAVPVKVKTGMQVSLELVDREGAVERLQVVIVPTRQANYAQGFLGEETPLAKAIMGKAPGEEVPYRVDELVKVRLLEVQPVDPSGATQAAAQREEEYRQAIADLEKRNATAFAASFSGKWGDYDPGAVEGWDQKPEPEEKP